MVSVRNLKVDSKKRITLGKMISDAISSYDATIADNGVITLVPKVEIFAEDMWLYKDKDAMQSLEHGISDFENENVKKLEKGFWDGI